MAADAQEVWSPGPLNQKENIKASDRDIFTASMLQEYDSMIRNGTIEVVEPPVDCKILDTYWIHTRKIGPDNTVTERTSRVIARGDQQRLGVHYHETFAPVVSPPAYRILFALAASLGWEIHRIDFVSATLNGYLDKVIYVRPPEHFPEEDGKVWRLKKPLHGLKQAPRMWYNRLRDHLLQHGWVKSDYDPCVFIYRSDEGFMFFAIHVDVVIITGNKRGLIMNFKQALGQNFRMTDKGTPSCFLGIDIRHDKGYSTSLCLRTAISQALKKHGLESIPTRSTPIDLRTWLQKEEVPARDDFRKRYQSKVGSLNDIAARGRPDISFACAKVSEHFANPNETHMDAVDNIYAYLRGTADFGMVYTPGSSQLVAYSDSDHPETPDMPRSGFILLLGNAPILWKFRPQSHDIVPSFAEADFVAASTAAKEAYRIKEFINELDTPLKIGAIPFFMDDRAEIELGPDLRVHSNSAIIRRCYHHVNEKVKDGDLELNWAYEENLAGMLTRRLSPRLFKQMRDEAGMFSDS